MSEKVDVYCVKGTNLYLYENRIEVTYLGDRFSELKNDNETPIETLCRLLNKISKKSNFINVFYNISSVIYELEKKYKQKLTMESYVKIINI